MHLSVKRYEDAHQLIKQALVAEAKDSNLRAFYIYFLSNSPGRSKDAKNFTFSSLKDDGSHDVYYLCAAGRLLYTEARENRDPSPAGATTRKENFIKAANIFLKALSIDPCCAVAAQGLAIMIAEDVLGSWAPGQMPDEANSKTFHARNARQALDVFAKVRESLNDGSVYVNMGHCYFIRDEYDKAIESVCCFYLPINTLKTSQMLLL
jgi:RNA polymerase-associated protein CTR9